MSSSFARRTVFERLKKIHSGELTVVCSDGTFCFGNRDAYLRARIVVQNERFFSRVLWAGGDGAADSWAEGDWYSPNPVAVLRLVARNLGELNSSNAMLSLASRLFHPLLPRVNRNSVRGSWHDIRTHSDLSNDFFRLFLDRNMVYSSAVFRSPTESLEEAQIEKLDRICRKLRLRAGDRLLEIGAGWGALALHASRNYRCQVTATTVSREQYDHAKRMFALAGEAGSRITLLLEDYRSLKGAFNKLASIETVESAGLENYDEFFSACDRLLTPDGCMTMQTIIVSDHLFGAYKRQRDWIPRRIFPGARPASLLDIQKSLLRTTRLSLFHAEDIGLHYAHTLAEWRRRFRESASEVSTLGFDDSFCRMWDYYLACCEAAFRERQITNIQLTLIRSSTRSPLYGEPWADGWIDSESEGSALAPRRSSHGILGAEPYETGDARIAWEPDVLTESSGHEGKRDHGKDCG
jgi:cyclopropane-fatty-acyl-phospholipid synthase